MTRRCNLDGLPIEPHDAAEVERFAAFLADPDPDRAAAYARHYPEETR